jgi:hypothetical protein
MRPVRTEIQPSPFPSFRVVSVLTVVQMPAYGYPKGATLDYLLTESLETGAVSDGTMFAFIGAALWIARRCFAE